MQSIFFVCNSSTYYTQHTHYYQQTLFFLFLLAFIQYTKKIFQYFSSSFNRAVCACDKY